MNNRRIFFPSNENHFYKGKHMGRKIKKNKEKKQQVKIIQRITINKPVLIFFIIFKVKLKMNKNPKEL